MLLKALQQKLEQWGLSPQLHCLLAASGGLDSSVLLHALCTLGYRPHLAHCHFGLRGTEADADADFVAAQARSLKLPFYLRHCPTRAVAEQDGLSTQMAARQLRYAFFAELQAQHQFEAVFTAHHLHDNLETLLLHFGRGSGLQGLAGIPPRRGFYYRPLLSLEHSHLRAYAQKEKLTWREDRSNQSDDYQRNALRHHVLPTWEKINPQLLRTAPQNFDRLRVQAQALQSLLAERLKEKLQTEQHYQKLPWSSLRHKDYRQELLRHWLAERDQWDWDTVYHLPQGQSGSYTQGQKLRLWWYREAFYLAPLPTAYPAVEIADHNRKMEKPVRLKMAKLVAGTAKLKATAHDAYLDYERLQFPLLLRPWRKGDRFVPLGMSGHKKLSDYLADEKIPPPLRARTWVLLSGTEIVWVLGHQIDDRYKVTPSTKSLYFVQLLEKQFQ